MAVSLYGKYRPQNFANLVGQDHIRETLMHEIQSGRLTHAYLFTGPRGTGKTSTARLIAKALNCTDKNAEGEPCDKCDFCTTISEGSLIDVIEIDAASNRGIDEIRELKEKIKFAPTHAKTKTYIVDEVHMLTKEAFNALLKILEEPPPQVYFILCTTEVHKIPETIISRCQRFDFKRIDVKTIMTRLNFIAQNEGIEAEDAAIELIARHVEGGLRDAIGILEQMTINNNLTADHVREHMGITGHQTIRQLLDLLEKKDVDQGLKHVNGVHNEGYDLTAFVREILECLRERLIADIQKGESGDLWLGMIMKFEEARNMLRTTAIPQLPLEIAVIKICGQRAESALFGIEKKKDKEIRRTIKEEEKQIETPHSTKQAQKEEEHTAEILKKEIEMEKYEGENITNHWPRVLEHVQPPSLRRSLADGKIVGDNGETVDLMFTSRFHMEKVNLIENRSKVEKAINQLLGKTYKVVCKLDSSAPKSVDVPARKTIKEPRAEPEIESGGKNLVEKALDIFGSEDF